ncbi:MAG: asparagine synthase (glutamine-hydrolyzing), partial [Tumebacillaceae bacterium]
LINKKYVMQLLEDHKNGVRDNARKVWTVLVFMMWHQIYVEGAVDIRSTVSPNVKLRRERQQELVSQ